MTDEEKKVIQLAFDSIDIFPASFPKQYTISDSNGDFITVPGELIQKFVDLSFKSYVLNHTETAIEKQRLKDY